MLEFLGNLLDSGIIGDIVAIFLSGVLFCIAIFLALRRRKSRQIFAYAYHDQLTGHTNGFVFQQKANEMIKDKDRKFVFYSTDIKRFKYINECYGRKLGDNILKAGTDLLKKYLSSDCIFARMDVDRFVILATYDGWNEITHNVVRIQQLIQRDLPKYDIHIKVEFDCGVYVLEGNELDITRAYDRAEFARNEAKKRTTSNIVVFNEKMKYRIHLESAMEEEKEKALENDEFKVYFQPQFDLSSMNFIGVEALVRWDSKVLGFLYPDSFIEFFEKNGFISKVDFHVLKVVCDMLEGLYQSGDEMYHCSVNHSRVTILKNDYLSNLKEFVSNYNFPLKYLEIEITENVFIDNTSATDIINGIKDIGIGVSMDDFGSGYSSLNVLKEISINVLKIDKDFLDQKMSPKTMAIVKGVVNMAKDINVFVICEGVETAEQVAFLQKIGCDRAQGYFFDKPMPMNEIKKKIQGEYVS